MTRLLEFVTDFCIGGTERQVVNLARDLDRSRFEVHLGCFRTRGEFYSEVLSRGIPLTTYPIRSLLLPGAALQGLRFARDLRRRRIQIVRSYGCYPNLFALPAAWLAGVRVRIASIRDTGDHLTPLQRRAQRWACRFAQRVVVNADAVRRRLVDDGYDPRGIVVIPNGIDLDRFCSTAPGRIRRELGVSEAAPVVGLVTRLTTLKGIEYFLAAMAHVARRFPSARFLVVGDGRDLSGAAYRRGLQREASLLGLEGRLLFTGFREDVPELLGELTVSVQPSLSEGLSNVVLESFAAGVPVVATAVGGNPEMVEGGVNGLLVPPRDAQALADAVCLLLGDPDRARRWGAEGRRLVADRFSLGAMVRRTAALYEDLLQADEERGWSTALEEEP
jgi:glycosyltransferase involved in cell wall biosynthesis